MSDLNPAAKAVKGVRRAPQQRRKGEAAARADAVVEFSGEELAQAVGDHKEDRDVGQQFLGLRFEFGLRHGGVEDAQFGGDAAHGGVDVAAVRLLCDAVGGCHDCRAVLGGQDVGPVCGVVDRPVGRIFAFGVGHPHVVERAAVEVVDDGYEHDQAQYDPS